MSKNTGEKKRRLKLIQMRDREIVKRARTDSQRALAHEFTLSTRQIRRILRKAGA